MKFSTITWIYLSIYWRDCAALKQPSGADLLMLLPQNALQGIEWLLITPAPAEITESSSGNWMTSNVQLAKTLTGSIIANLSKSDADVAIVVESENCTMFYSNLNNIAEIYAYIDPTSEMYHWRPKVFMIWPPVVLDSGGGNTNFSLLPDLTRQNFTKRFLVDSDVYIVSVLEPTLKFSEMYFLGGHLILRELDVDTNNGRDLSPLLQKSKRRGDFNGAQVVAVGVMDPAYYIQCHVEFPFGNSTQVVVGLCKEILSDFEFALNFSTKIINATGWISHLPNGTLGGLGKHVIGGDADLGVSHSLLLPYRQQHLTFLQPTEMTGAEVFFIQPEPSSLHDIYLSPFHRHTWFCFCLTWLCIVISRHIFARVVGKLNEEATGAYELNDTYMAAKDDILLWSIGAISQQGWHSTPSSIPIRIAVIFSSFFGLIVYVAFSGSLVSKLSDQSIPIKTLQQLVDSSFQIYVDPSAPYNTTMGALSNYKGDYSNWKNIEEGTYLVLTSSSAYLTYEDAFRSGFDRLNQSADFYCDNIYRIRPTTGTYHSGLIVRKRSEYKEFLNHRIIQMKQVGLNKRLNIRYKADTAGTCQSGQSKNNNYFRKKGLRIKDLWSAYVIQLSGICIGLGLLILEIIYQKPVLSYN